MGIIQSQNIAGGLASAAAGGAREVSFSTHRIGETRPIQSFRSATYASDNASKENLTLNPQPHIGIAANTAKDGGGGADGGLDLFKLTEFSSQYGPAGFNTLSESSMTMLTSFANAVKAGKTGFGGGAANMISNFMKSHASAYAGRSSIDKTTDGNDVAITSGGASMGWNDAAAYGTGSSEGEPVEATFDVEPPSFNGMLAAATVDLPDPPVEDESGSDEGVTFTGQGTAAADTSVNPMITAAVDPMVDRRATIRKFLASPAGRTAFSSWMKFSN